MNISFVSPRPELRRYIESFWVVESPTGLPAKEGNLAAPNGCPKLTFAYRDSFVSIADGKAHHRPVERLNFVGNRDSSIRIQSSARPIGCIGIEFRPYGAFAAFGTPMADVTQFLGDADDVLGTWARRTQERLSNLASTTERVAFLEDQLALQLRKNQSGSFWRRHARTSALVAYCVNMLKARDGLMSIRELEAKSGSSGRYLNLLFKQQVGLSPKVLARIYRFQRFYRFWAERQSYDLLKHDLYEYFYDQSHFTREFRRMTGHTLRQLADEVTNEFGRLVSLR